MSEAALAAIRAALEFEGITFQPLARDHSGWASSLLRSRSGVGSKWHRESIAMRHTLSIYATEFGHVAERQKRFPFLLGDPGHNGRCARLPVDAFYPSLSLVIEYCEEQHSGSVAHFDKPWKLTVSGVHRGQQRKIYDERRRVMLPEHGIKLIEISCTALEHNARMRLLKNPESDELAICRLLEAAGALGRY